jgi:flagellar basal-body rod protein FlgF/flagellar basal-body rod protein FlgG
MPMQNALLVGLSRQMALGREMDVVANNIANLDTTGYKADGSMFEEYLGSAARTGAGDARVSFVLDRGIWHDMSQGPIQRTGNPLDVAIDGNAFLVVQTPRGERYTRNGALQINSQGQLVTSEGLQVVGQNGPIVFQPSDREISIGIDGLISVREGQNTIDAQRGKLKLASFAQPQRLQKDGASTYMAPAGVTPQAPTNAKVTQGAVEKSNVQSVMEMTRMVQITRAYTETAQILQNQSDMRRSAIEKLADVPA